MVSVLMSVYNEKENELKKAIDSILNQTYNKLEFIIVLDNPQNEKLKNILLDYKNRYKKIKLIVNDKNIGLAKSLNKAFLLSNGKYIARMDGDDISYTTRIEKQIEFMEKNKEYAILGTNRVDIDENDNIIKNNRRIITNSKSIEKVLMFGVPLTHPSIIIRRDVFEILGGYRSFRVTQDYDLYLRCISKKYLISNLKEPLIQYRIRQMSITKQNLYLQMLSGAYIKKINSKGSKYTEYSESMLMQNFDEYCKKKGLYNSTIVSNYIKYINAIKQRKFLLIILCILKMPSLIIHFLKLFLFYITLKFL